jgi:hypothetical protein
MSEKSLSERMKLDKYSLDDNAIEQPDIYRECSENWAKASLERDKAKESLEVVTARVSKAIRENPEKYGIEKVTDKAVQENLLLNEEYRKASKAVIQAQYNVNVLQSMKEAAEHRGRALRILSDLYSGSYFSATAGEKFKQSAVERGKEAMKEKLHESKKLTLRKKV